MADAPDRFCPICGRLSPPYVQVCLCGHRFPPQAPSLPEAVVLPPVEEKVTPARDVLAICGFVLGVLGAVCCFFWPVSLALTILAFFVSSAGFDSRYRMLAVAGLACVLVSGVLITLAVFGYLPQVRVVHAFGHR